MMHPSLIFCLLLTFTVCLSDSQPVLSISPVDPEVLAGTSLNFTCMVHRTSFNALDIRWEIDGEDIEVGKTNVISDKEARLTLTNLTIGEDGRERRIICKLSSFKAETVLLVGTVPPPPQFECRSTNIVVYWCDWSVEFTGVKLNYTFQFKSKDEVWIDCPEVKGNSCIVSNKNGNPGRNHYVRVIAQNIFGFATTTKSFDPFYEAIPLTPLISKVSSEQPNMNVCWRLQENCRYCLSLKYEFRYRQSNQRTNWTKLNQKRKRCITLEDVQERTEYELQVRSKFLKPTHRFSEWSPARTVIVPSPLLLNVTDTSSDTFSLKWNAPEQGSVVTYYIQGNYTHQTFNETINKNVTTNYADFKVPCITFNEIIIVVYNLEVTYSANVEDVLVEGPPSSILHTGSFMCQKQVLVTKKQESPTTNAQVSDSQIIVTFLSVGVVIIFTLLVCGTFKIYFRKQVFIEWPEPKFFKVEYPIEPRSVEREIFDELKSKRSDSTSKHSSTSSDQGFHELSPHSPTYLADQGMKDTYVTSPYRDVNDLESPINKIPAEFFHIKPTPSAPGLTIEHHVSPVNNDMLECLQDVSKVKQDNTEYFQLQGLHDALQLSPLLQDSGAAVSNSDPHTAITSIASQTEKLMDGQQSHANSVTDPYCKLDKLLHSTPDNNRSRSTEYTSVFTNEASDYSGEEDEIFINEDEIQNLLDGVAQKSQL